MRSKQRTRWDVPLRNGGDLDDLVSHALGLTVRKHRAASSQGGAKWVERLRDAVVDTHSERRLAVLAEMRASGLSVRDMCDVVIPEVARNLGEAWVDDRMSFADVTIACARLQSLLREDILAGTGDYSERAGELLVLVRADEHHTLGALVLTGQLRSHGVSVRLMMGRPEPDVLTLVEDCDFDAILLSISRADAYPGLLRSVAAIRSAAGGNVPVIVGGSILELGEPMALEVSGADYATNDIFTALAVCRHDDRTNRAN